VLICCGEDVEKMFIGWRKWWRVGCVVFCYRRDGVVDIVVVEFWYQIMTVAGYEVKSAVLGLCLR